MLNDDTTLCLNSKFGVCNILHGIRAILVRRKPNEYNLVQPATEQYDSHWNIWLNDGHPFLAKINNSIHIKCAKVSNQWNILITDKTSSTRFFIFNTNAR